ncbi:hypothetical protein RJ641_014726 [Dillenia turbinata]|uniref:Uncharacterized protein n=1 Tax=Dillenia turbinata TaxID=194707 RepID=A0AAN8Z566_9MAGN
MAACPSWRSDPFGLQALNAQPFRFSELQDVFGSLWYFIQNHACKDKELAKFIGYPFSSNKEKEGVIKEIINFCSFESISKYEVNKFGKLALCGSCKMVNSYVLYRKLEIGD